MRRVHGLSENRCRLQCHPMADQVTPEYRATLQRLTGAEKLRTAFALYWEARKLKAARLRQLHPEWSEEEIQEEVKRIFRNAVT